MALGFTYGSRSRCYRRRRNNECQYNRRENDGEYCEPKTARKSGHTKGNRHTRSFRKRPSVKASSNPRISPGHVSGGIFRLGTAACLCFWKRRRKLQLIVSKYNMKHAISCVQGWKSLRLGGTRLGERRCTAKFTLSCRQNSQFSRQCRALLMARTWLQLRSHCTAQMQPVRIIVAA